MRCPATAWLFGALAVCLLATPAPAAVSEAQVNELLRIAPGHSAIPVIVVLPRGVDPQSFTDPDKRRRRSALLQALRRDAEGEAARIRRFAEEQGAKNVTQLWGTHALALSADPVLLRRLAAFPAVEEIRHDRKVRIFTDRQNHSIIRKTKRVPDERTTPHPVKSREWNEAASPAARGDTAPAWNLAAVNAPDLWELGVRGAGVVLASLDTGVDGQHPALAAQYRGGVNSWYDPHGEHTTPVDTDGHGTQALSLAIGRDSDGQAIGVAPEAQWIAAKLFNDAGIARESDLHRSLQWVLDPDGNPDTDDAPDVVYLPWTVDRANRCNRAFQDELDLLRASGIAVILSAGNAGPGRATSVSPANNPGQFSVGSVSRDGTVSSFSSRGPSACTGGVFPEILAPGEQVLAADLSFGGMPNYAVVTGTSFAAPHVAGAVALLMSASPGVPLAVLESALKATTVPVRTPGDPSPAAYGLIDVMAAYRAVLTGSGIVR